MKKLLLLITAILALIPPLRAQDPEPEVKTMQFFVTNSDENYNSTNPLKYVFTSSSATASWSNFTSALAGGSTKYFRKLTKYNEENNDYVLLETNVNAVGRPPASGLSYNTSKTITVQSNGKLTFSMCFGKIKSVKLITSTNASSVSNPNFALNYFKASDANNSKEVSASASTGFVFAPIDDSKPMTIVRGVYSIYIREIHVTYEVVEPKAPLKPQLDISDTYHYKYDADNNSLGITCLPKVSIVKVPTPSYGSAIYYTFNDEIPSLTSTSDASANTADSKSKWVKYTGGSATTSNISFATVKPADMTELDSSDFTLRVIAYGSMSDKFSEELVTKCHYIHLPSPEVDVASTTAISGQTYDAATNTVYYTGVNPVVYFKAVMGTEAPIISCYTTDLTNPLSGGTKVPSSTEPTEVKFPNWTEGMDYPPTGTTNVIKVLSYVNSGFNFIVYDEYYTANKQPFTITVKRVAPSAPSTTRINGYTIDGGITQSWDNPKSVRINDKVEFNLAIEGANEVYERYFDHEPTSAELSENSAYTKSTIEPQGDKLTVTKADNLDVANGRTECWLALKNHNEGGYSQPTVIHIALQGPADPSLRPLYGYIQEKDEFTILPSAFRSLIEVDDNTTVVKYQFLKEVNGVTPSAPDPSQWESLDITSGSTDFDSKNITGKGRLFLIAQAPLEGNASAMTSSDYVYYDFTTINPTETKLADKNSWDESPLGEDALVVINEPLRIMGFYGTNAVNYPQYMYLMNRDGQVLKVSGNSNSTYTGTGGKIGWSSDILQLDGKNLMETVYVMPAGSVVGRIHFNDDKDLPELEATRGVTYDSENLTPLFGVPQQVDDWTLSEAGAKLHKLENRTEINRANDFGRYVELRSLKWLDANNEFEMADKDNSRMQLYRRLTVTLPDQTLEKDKLYRVKGFIGLAEGKLSIFPIAPIEQCPGTPNLYAPNPIKPGVDDTDDEGRITVQAVSDEVEIRAEGHAFGASKFFYTRSDRESEGMIPVDDSTKKFVLDLSKDADINVDVYAQLGDMTSLIPARIRVVKKESVKVESIHDFKTREFASPSTDRIYQLDKEKGQVIIEKITDKYIYVRDYTADPVQQLADDEHMNRLLILNNNGWTADVADAKNENAEPRELQVGDVITNFAIVPTHDRGNLISNATGFARTFRLVGHDKDATGSAMPINAGPNDNFAFTAEHRMRFVTLKGAQVYREKNEGADKDLYPYNYTITTIDGTPRMRMDVFVRSGFAEAYAENTPFNLTGIVMLDSDGNDTNDASKFAFALQSFTGGGKLAMPEVFIAGTSDSGKEDISYSLPGTIEMKAPSKTADDGVLAAGTVVKLYYALGGIDPLKDIQARREYQGKNWETDKADMLLGDGDVEIRVFAAAPGMTPSDVVTRRFKKNSHDVQFILNFLETAKEGENYRFTGDTRVVAVGGEYLFVAGRVGHYLPIRLTRGWDGLGITSGKMLTDFTVGYTVDEHGNRLATADGFESTFNPTDAAPGETLQPTPDEATKLSLKDHPRRLVRLKGVKVSAPSIATAADNGITEWEVMEQGDNETHIMPVGKLGAVKILDADGNVEGDAFVDGESYDIVGFVMLNSARDAKMEIWPVEARHLSRVAEVEVSFSAGTTRQVNSDGEIEAAFDGMTMVTLSCETRGARMLYALGRDNADLVWYEYQRPFAVTANEYIHAKAEAANAVESDHTHIVLTRKDMASDVTFRVDDSTPGKVVVTLSAAPGAKIFWWTALNEKEVLYDQDTPIVLEETDMVFAYATESGKVDGKVCSKFVKVTGGLGGDQNTGDRVSGRVVFSLDNSEEGKVKVNIKPEIMPEGDWDIYYTTDPDVILTANTGTLYSGAFDVTESSLVMAILVEHNRPEAEATVCEVYVWVSPTAIDSVGADSVDSVRVDGDCIIAPAGSEVYDLSGRRVRPEGLRSGIYIVRTPDGNAVKVAIR